MKTYTVHGYYGSGRTPCLVFAAQDGDGHWYAVEGSKNVNYTPDPVEDGVDVEMLRDTDAFTWPEGVGHPGDLVTAIKA